MRQRLQIMQTESNMPKLQDAIALSTIEADLRREDAYARDGHTARTLLREPDLRVVVVALQEGASMADHQIDQTGSIQVLTGQIRLRFPERGVELKAGQLFIIPAGAKHEVNAMVESAFILTLGWRGNT
jgi:quercetin dioxygenase-like cupin family protein